jgi:hypothetical protein
VSLLYSLAAVAVVVDQVEAAPVVRLALTSVVMVDVRVSR